MPYKTRIPPTGGGLVEVSLVEARVSVWASPMDSKHLASAVMPWKLTLMHRDAPAIFIGGGSTNKIFTLYTPDMAQGTELIYDDACVYTLEASGVGKWNAELHIMARKAEAGAALVELGKATLSRDMFMPAIGRNPAPGLPAGGQVPLELEFSFFQP